MKKKISKKFQTLIERFNKGLVGIKGDGYFGAYDDGVEKFFIAITKGEKIVASVRLTREDVESFKDKIDEFLAQFVEKDSQEKQSH